MDDTSPAGIAAAISQASANYGVPADVLNFIWKNESSGASGPYQEIVTNSSGYGGFFGLPRSLLGTVQQQADNVAKLLMSYKQPTWGAAINYYNTGNPNSGYGSNYAGSAFPVVQGPPASGQPGSTDSSGQPILGPPAPGEPGGAPVSGGGASSGGSALGNLADFFTSGGWGKLLLSIVGGGLVIGGMIIYFKGDLPKAVPIPV